METRFSVGSFEDCSASLGCSLLGSPTASMSPSSSLPIVEAIHSDDEVNNASCCTSRLSHLVNNPKFSDVTLVVGGRRYHGHRLLLANASYVLELVVSIGFCLKSPNVQMLTNQSWIDSGQSELVLREDDDCCEVFEDFLKYIYTGRVILSSESVLGLLVLADKYNISDLKGSCASYMRRHLVGPADRCQAVVWYQYALACNSLGLQAACLDYIVLNMDVVIQSSHWACLDFDNLVVILSRSDVIIESEYALLKAVIRWLTDECRISKLDTNMATILPYVRFPMMLPEHLAEFEESSFEKTHHDAFASHLLTAYRYHALSLKGRPTTVLQSKDKTAAESQSTPQQLQFLYRNYTDDSYSIHVEVVRKSIRSCPRVSSRVERLLNLPTTVCNANGSTDGGQSKMKLTFYPQGYYTTSLWNGQLNLAKSTDQTKLVIAHRGGMELRRVQITVAVCARRNDTFFVDRATTVDHTFDAYGTCEIDNVVDLSSVKAEDSPFVVDGSLYVKVFVRPLSFHNNVVVPL